MLAPETRMRMTTIQDVDVAHVKIPRRRAAGESIAAGGLGARAVRGALVLGVLLEDIASAWVEDVVVVDRDDSARDAGRCDRGWGDGWLVVTGPGAGQGEGRDGH